MNKKKTSYTPLATDSFDGLVQAIKEIDQHFTSQAGKAVNTALTLRNWLIGAYLREYEQHGNDRASYGSHLLETLAGHLSRQNPTGMSARSLRLYRQFYLTYPVIWQSLAAKSASLLGNFFWQSLPAKFQQVRLLNTAAATPSPPSRRLSENRLIYCGRTCQTGFSDPFR